LFDIRYSKPTQPLNAEAASLIEKETLKKRITNVEQGIMNVEGEDKKIEGEKVGRWEVKGERKVLRTE